MDKKEFVPASIDSLNFERTEVNESIYDMSGVNIQYRDLAEGLQVYYESHDGGGFTILRLKWNYNYTAHPGASVKVDFNPTKHSELMSISEIGGNDSMTSYNVTRVGNCSLVFSFTADQTKGGGKANVEIKCKTIWKHDKIETLAPEKQYIGSYDGRTGENVNKSCHGDGAYVHSPIYS